MSFSKERIPVRIDDKYVGTAEISDSGMVSMIINSDVVAATLKLGSIEHLSISAKLKKD
jgi:hypothetical protein